jgi:hypothetical protein
MSINKFTVQESVNTNAFSDWNYEELDLNDGSAITDDTCDLTDDPTITHDSNANIKAGMAVTGSGIPASSYVGIKTSNTEFELYKDGSPVSTTGGAANNVELTFTGGEDTESATYITNSNPAKKIVLYEVPGSASSYLQDIDTLTLTINSQTDSAKKIKIDATDLPFTINGTMMTSLSVTVDQANLTDKVALLSFH